MKRKKIMRRLSFAVPFKLSLIIVIVMAVMASVLTMKLTSFTSQLMQGQVALLADKNANTVTEYLDAMQMKAGDLATEVERDQILGKKVSEPLLKEALNSILDDSRIFSAYIALEPDAYYKNTPAGLSYYAYRDAEKINLDVNNDYDAYSTGDYYAVSKKTLKPYVTEPYSYKLSNGQTIWLITISNPIFDKNGKFLGVANCDILTDTLNNLSYDLNNYKTAYSSIITNKSIYVTNTAKKELFGKTFSSKNQAVSDSIKNGKELRTTGTNTVFSGASIEVYEPLDIDGINQHWVSAFVVNKSEAFSAVYFILKFMIAIAVAGVVVLSLWAIFLLKRALKPVTEIVTFAKALGSGNLSAELDVHVDNELGDIAYSLKQTATVLKSYIKELSYVLAEIADCNLDVKLKQEFQGDFIPIQTAILSIINSLDTTMKKIETASTQVSLGAGQISDGAQMLSQGATEQAATIEELSASIQGISDATKENAHQVHEAAGFVEEAVHEIEVSNVHMKQMLSSMEEISGSSAEISKIIKVIEDIAFQTNILALNAAVEAARAGDAGKGFAVVAEEVRNLATKSAEASKQTNDLIEDSVKAVSEGTGIASATAESLKNVAEKSLLLKNNIERIDESSANQAESIAEITQGLTQVSVVIQSNSATAEESAAASEELHGQAETLHNEVIRFQLSKD